MTSLTRSWTNAATALALLLVAACAGQAGPASRQPTGRPLASVGSADPGTVALRVDFTGGLSPRWDLVDIMSRLPLISVYRDGRVITRRGVGRSTSAVPIVVQRRVSPKQVEILVRKALDAGVDTGVDVGHPPAMDAPSTRFTVVTGASTRTLEVYALVDEHTLDPIYRDDVAGVTGAQRVARQKLIDLLAELQDLATTLGAGAISKPESYPASALAVIARPYTLQPQPAQPELAWPGPSLPGAVINTDLGVSCLTVTGSEANAVLAAAAKANIATPWTSGGARWLLSLRPLLPDESDCAGLATRT
jgi:hypothetical protein